MRTRPVIVRSSSPRGSRLLLGLAVTSLFLPGVTRAAPEEHKPEWRRIAEPEGMLIEARPMRDTRLREIRVQARSPLPPEAIFQVIWNVAAQREFAPNLKTLKVLRSSDEEIVVHERIKIPVAQDRDYVLRLTKKLDPTTGVHQVFAVGASELGPPPERGVVRMTRLSSSFTIAPGKDGGTLLTYVSFGDPAGAIPEWIIRAADVRGPRDFVRALLTRAKQEQQKQQREE